MPTVKNVGEPCAGKSHARFEVAAGGNQASRLRRAAQAPLADPYLGPRLMPTVRACRRWGEISRNVGGHGRIGSVITAGWSELVLWSGSRTEELGMRERRAVACVDGPLAGYAPGFRGVVDRAGVSPLVGRGSGVFDGTSEPVAGRGGVAALGVRLATRSSGSERSGVRPTRTCPVAEGWTSCWAICAVWCRAGAVGCRTRRLSVWSRSTASIWSASGGWWRDRSCCGSGSRGCSSTTWPDPIDVALRAAVARHT